MSEERRRSVGLSGPQGLGHLQLGRAVRVRENLGARVTSRLPPGATGVIPRT